MLLSAFGAGDLESRPLAVAMAFVDAGYLTAGARSCLKVPCTPRIDGDALTSWARFAYRSDIDLLRTYVYDAQYPDDADRYPDQRAYFDALAAEPGIRLRLGHLVERSAGSPRAAWQQKGVDTLVVLDLVRLAQLRAYDIALIIAGDRDLAEALRVVADDHARRVILSASRVRRLRRSLSMQPTTTGLSELTTFPCWSGNVRPRTSRARPGTSRAPRQPEPAGRSALDHFQPNSHWTGQGTSLRHRYLRSLRPLIGR